MNFAWTAVNAAEIDRRYVRVDAERNSHCIPRSRSDGAGNGQSLSNAVRYGGENATVVARADNGDLLLEVHDDGPGVPRKYELMIWQRFERGPNRLNAVVPGSGIGLAVTKAIAKAHGGSAGYRRSDRLGGACFWIVSPAGSEKIRPAPDSPSPRLIVVEDDAQTA